MSDSPLVTLLKTADNIKSAIELGNSTMVIADSAKLIAQISAAIATEGFLRTYSALDGFGRTLGLWRLGQGINGQGIGKQEALAAFVASELVGLLIDKARDLDIGGWLYDFMNEPRVSKDELIIYIDDASWLGDHPNGSDFYQDNSNYRFGSAQDPDTEANHRYENMKNKMIKWKIVVTDFDGITQKVYEGVASPIVIDIDGDGINTTNSWTHSVNFDITGDGILDRTAWVSGSDAFLALDRNQDGKINDATELFGGLGRGDGFSKLSDLDTNHDGVLDGSDKLFEELLLWKDLNSNGISEEGEITNASEAGLESINIDYKSQEVYQNRNLLGEISTAKWKGKIVEVVDVYFRHSDGSKTATTATHGVSDAKLSASSLAALQGKATEIISEESSILRTSDASSPYLPLEDDYLMSANAMPAVSMKGAAGTNRNYVDLLVGTVNSQPILNSHNGLESGLPNRADQFITMNRPDGSATTLASEAQSLLSAMAQFSAPAGMMTIGDDVSRLEALKTNRFQDIFVSSN